MPILIGVLRRHRGWLAPTVVFAALPVVLSTESLYIATVIAATVAAVLGISLMMGPIGPRRHPLMISFGQSVFVAIGAYTVGISQDSAHVNFFLAAAIGLVCSAIIGAGIAVAGAKLGFFGLGMATFSLAFVVGALTQGQLLANFTQANMGLSVAATAIGSVSLGSPVSLYYFTVIFMAAALIITANFKRSRAGQALELIQQSEEVAASVGVVPIRAKVMVFVISAVYASCTGSVLAEVLGFVSPDSVSPQMSVDLVAMAVLGGSGTLVGPVVGAALFTVLPYFGTAFKNNAAVVSAFVLLVVLIAAPGGIVGVASRLAQRVTSALGGEH